MVLTVSACSIFPPFVDRRREAGQPPESLFVGKSQTDAPAICYNSWTTNFETIKKLAVEECVKHGTGTDVEAVNQTIFSCRLLIPNHEFFKCITPVKEEKNKDKEEEKKENEAGSDNKQEI